MNPTNFSPYSSSPESKLESYSPHSQPIVMPVQTAVPATKGSKAKPRKRVNTAEKRHQHNAVERQRRETLNSKFFVLARLLPSLAKSARPSKSSIVNGSISHLTKQRGQRLLAARLLKQLCAERDKLAKECNEWRAAGGYVGDRDAIPASAWTDEMDEVCAVEKETFGEFAIEEGDEAEDGEEQDEGMDVGVNGAMAMGIEQATAAVARFDSTAMGLITPRSSTEIDPIALALGMSLPLPDMPATQPVDITWPADFAFGAGSLSAEPLGMSQHQLQRSSSASLPFAGFMSEGSSGSPTGSILGSIPTPPMTSDFSQFTHTPSPRSSGSFDEKAQQQKHSLAQQQQFAQPPAHQAPGQAAFTQPRTQWSQQEQLLFLHSIQQQQLQHTQLAKMQHSTRGQAAPFGRSQSAGSETFAQTQNIHSARQSLPLYPSTLQQMQMQQQHIQAQQHQMQMQQAQAQQHQMSGGGSGVPRMSGDQLEAWRKIAMGSGGGGGGVRAELGMWAQNALKGF